MAGLSGSWARERATYRPVAHGVRTADPVHATEWYGEGMDDHEAPPYPDYGQPGDAPWLDAIVDTAGTDAATLDYTDHQVDASHSTDFRETGGHQVGPLVLTDLGENYTTPYWQGTDPWVPRYGEVRGRNARPEMNPDGFRRGLGIGRTWADRRRWVSHRRTDVRVTTVGGAEVPDFSVDTVPAPEDRGHYASPFSVWAKVFTGGPAQPMLRRTPPAIDDAVMVDGTEQAGADAGVDGAWLL